MKDGMSIIDKTNHVKICQNLKIISLIVVGNTSVFGQVTRVEIAQKNTADGVSPIWYVVLFVFVVALLAVLFEWIKRKKREKSKNSSSRKSENFNDQEVILIDADEEVEWLHNKSKEKLGKKTKKRQGQDSGNLNSRRNRNSSKQLPIFEVQQIGPSGPYIPLPISDDEMLLNAIEQSNEEFERDEEVRELALKILAAFKTRNSVEAISEVALYDPSVKLRSKAISILAVFDHEMVFETLLLACADPTREIRAAAASGIFQLSFGRIDAWLRIIEMVDLGRINQCARALTASDLVGPSIERLIHPDKNYATEALAIMLILINSGETDLIFEYLQNDSEMILKKAILHVLKIAGTQEAIEELLIRYQQNEFTVDIGEEIDEILETHKFAMGVC
jgi:hypothetical protein